MPRHHERENTKTALTIENDTEKTAFPPITRAHLDLMEQIEKLPPSEQQTATIIKASEVLRMLQSIRPKEPEAIITFHSPGAEAICRERRRQVEEEGFDAAHDAILHPGALNLFASYYCLHGQKEFLEREMFPDGWNKKWAKRQGFPYPTRRDLERAGALIAAALDRMGEEE